MIEVQTPDIKSLIQKTRNEVVDQSLEVIQSYINRAKEYPKDYIGVWELVIAIFEEMHERINTLREEK